MFELLQTVNALLVLALPFGLLLCLVNQRAGRAPLAPSGVLLVYPLYFLFQIVLAKSLHYLRALSPLNVVLGYLLADLCLIFLLYRTRSLPKPPYEKKAEENEKATPTVSFVLGSTIVILVLISAVGLVKPILTADEQTYHLPMVANYVQNRSLSPWATQCLRQIVRPNGAELQMFHLAFLGRSDAGMEFFQLLGFAVSLVATYEIAMLLYGRRILAFLGMALLLGTPKALFEASQANNDLIFTVVILCGFYWLIRASKETSSQRFQGIALLALCGALACNVKILGICVFASFFAALFLLVLLRRQPFRSLIEFTGIGALLLLILVGDLYWANFLRSGIPFGVIMEEDSVNFVSGFSNFKLLFDYYVIRLGLIRPFLGFSAQHSGHHLGVLFLPLFLFGIAAILKQVRHLRSPKNKGVFTLSLLAALLFLSITAFRKPDPQDHRFMVWMIPAFGLLTLSWGERWREKTISRLAILATFLALVYFGYIYTKPSFFGVAVRESFAYLLKHRELPFITSVSPADPWLTQRFSGYEVLEQKARPGDPVLYVGGKSSTMYPSWGRRFSRRVTGVEDVYDAVEKIDSQQYRFIVSENGAESVLRYVSRKRAEALGYTNIFKGRKRLIYKRPSSS